MSRTIRAIRSIVNRIRKHVKLGIRTRQILQADPNYDMKFYGFVVSKFGVGVNVQIARGVSKIWTPAEHPSPFIIEKKEAA